MNCLVSIDNQDYEPVELVVVDNKSQDDTVDALMRQHPEARIIALDSNTGAAEGRNIGLKATQGRIIICLDDDAELASPASTRQIVDRFEQDARLGIAALRIVDPNTGQTQRSAIPRRDKKDIGTQVQVTYFSAAGCAIRRQVFVDRARFPAEYVVYGEELAFSLQALEAGWKTIYMPDIEVLHHSSHSSQLSAGRIYYQTRNRIWFASRYLPWPYALCHGFLWTVYMFKRAIFSLQIPHFLRGWWDGMRGLPTVLKDRTPVSASTLRKLKVLSGRLYY